MSPPRLLALAHLGFPPRVAGGSNRSTYGRVSYKTGHVKESKGLRRPTAVVHGGKIPKGILAIGDLDT